MCRIVTARYACSPRSAASARHLVREQLSGWGLDGTGYTEVRDTAELLVSELVTNAVRHARTDVAVTIGLAGETLEVGVSDADPQSDAAGLQRARERLSEGHGPAALAQSGRGLPLLDAMAQAWGISVLAAGKQVWFTLRASGWLSAADCSCEGRHLDAVVLGSGRRVVHMLSA